ncbi:peptidoglycan-binding protein [Streptomyces avermitilis]|uniref:peptidoglycan-binding protein n=1 Tax=Streptomyces avermitilis TaxID=33903 RepID=UPI0033DB2297
MATPEFEEFDPASGCDCPGCVLWRRGGAPSGGCPRTGESPFPLSGQLGRPAARGALVLAAAAGAVLCASPSMPAVAAAHGPVRPGIPAGDGPENPQGGKAPLHGPGGRPAEVKAPPTTRAAIIDRARTWTAAEIPYSMSAYWSDGYRQDCSGFVSMAWNLGDNEWTGSLDKFGFRISKEEIKPGDILLFHNPDNPEKGSHVVLFGGWTDYTHTDYVAYEETPPAARKQTTPYAYWSNSDRYVAYRYMSVLEDVGVSGSTAAEPLEVVPDYPGAASFGPGADNRYVTQLGRLLVDRGGARFYTTGPGPRWSDADRRATQAFQEAQGWQGAEADGLPGPTTWAYLLERKGRDIPPADSAGVTGSPEVTGSSGVAGSPGGKGSSGIKGGPGTKGSSRTKGGPGPAGRGAGPSSHGVTGYPGRGMFRPGAHNEYVTRLGERLVTKGFGTHYTQGPGSGPRWSEGDRRSVEAFQRAQGWRGGAADGYPGPETWRRLFA